MTPIIVICVAALVLVGVMWGVGVAGRGTAEPDEAPDRQQRTGDAVEPPAHPDRPVPGSRTDRDRKGVVSEGASAPVAPDD